MEVENEVGKMLERSRSRVVAKATQGIRGDIAEDL